MLLKDITIVYTLAPRKIDTINESIKSLRMAGIENKIYISAEPGEYKITDKKVDITIHKQRKGCFLHYDWILNHKKFLKTKYLFIIQDDFVFSERIRELSKLKDEGFGFYDLYLSDQIFPFINRQGWNDIRFGWSTAGACFLFDTKIIPLITNSAFYVNHKTEYVVKVKNQQVDSCIGESCKLLNLRTYFPSISYAKHIGESLIGHTDPFFGKFNFAKCHLPGYNKMCDKVIVGIASIPNRHKQLKKTIDSLYNQADTIILSLNGYSKIPVWLKRYSRIQVVLSDNSKGDASKFLEVGNVSGYYFGCDDDIIYPSDYVEFMVRKIEKNNRKFVVGLHGVNVPGKIDSYYHGCSRIHYSQDLTKSQQVNILGTGLIAFHTDTLKITIDDFKLPNMADIRLAIKAQEQGVPMICVARPRDMVTQQETEGSIWEEHRNNDKQQTDLCNSIIRRQF